MFNYSNNRTFKGEANIRNMKRFLSVSITPHDLFMLISGRPPLAQRPDLRLRFQRSEGEILLTVTETWGRVIQKIWLHDSGTRVKRLEMYKLGGGLRYRVMFDNVRKVEDFEIPHVVTVSTPDHKTFRLKIRRLWVNTLNPEEVFMLEGNKSWYNQNISLLKSRNNLAF